MSERSEKRVLASCLIGLFPLLGSVSPVEATEWSNGSLPGDAGSDAELTDASRTDATPTDATPTETDPPSSEASSSAPPDASALQAEQPPPAPRDAAPIDDPGSDSTNDEATDEASDDTTGSTDDEATDEASDEATDETSDVKVEDTTDLAPSDDDELTGEPSPDAAPGATVGVVPGGAAAGAASSAAAPAPTPRPTAPTEPDPPAAEPHPTATAEPSQTEEPPEEKKPKAPRSSKPFGRGRIQVGGGLGWASSNKTDWLILSVGGGYFVLPGLEVGGAATFWVIGDPFIATLTPDVRYVLHFVPIVKPYIGTFYRHYFVADGNKDTDSVGARAGIYLMTGRHSYFGGGVIYEHFLDDDLFSNRDQWYPEISFTFSF